MREIDYNKLLQNVDEMINVLEYDSSRSTGKAKINAQTLINLFTLKEVFTKKNSKKTTPKKEVGNDG